MSALSLILSFFFLGSIPLDPFNKISPTRHPVSPPFFQDVIVIDPGHGGKDTGAKSLEAPIYLEKRLTLACSKYLKKALEILGYKPLMTRTADHSLSLEDRVEFAEGSCADLFVSIHFNSAPNIDAHGIEVYYYNGSGKYNKTKASKDLALNILKRSVEYTGARSRKAKHGDFYVIRESTRPSVLVEGGFLTNTEEMNHLKDPTYLKKLAIGIARGIDDYLTQQRSAKAEKSARKFLKSVEAVY
jgi:N-acetylmuramoyl-L-alanine amidase